jgi:hypothetical protein
MIDIFPHRASQLGQALGLDRDRVTVSISGLTSLCKPLWTSFFLNLRPAGVLLHLDDSRRHEVEDPLKTWLFHLVSGSCSAPRISEGAK